MTTISKEQKRIKKKKNTFKLQVYFKIKLTCPYVYFKTDSSVTDDEQNPHSDPLFVQKALGL